MHLLLLQDKALRVQDGSLRIRRHIWHLKIRLVSKKQQHELEAVALTVAHSSRERVLSVNIA